MSRMSFRNVPVLLALALVLVFPLMAACAAEDEPDEGRVPGIVTGDVDTAEQTGERRSIFSASSDAEPEPTTGAPAPGSGEPAPTDVALGGTVQISVCPRRQPAEDVMPPPSAPSAETDKEALLAIFEATGGETWDDSGTWAGFSPIGEWQGVGVDGNAPAGDPRVAPTPVPGSPTPTPTIPGADAGRVTGLALSGLTGPLPPELGNLTALETLSITNSDLSGELPPELGNLSSLETLIITDSRLGGELPPELGNLSGLETLAITGGQVTGELPPELGSLSVLQTLNLSGNQLCGEIPPELHGLTALKSLELGRNQMTGMIPDALASLVGLETLNLESNLLEGEVPSSLSAFSNLAILNLSNNQLAGELPPAFDDLALNLTTLHLDGNPLEGCRSDFLRDFVDDSDDSLPVCTPETHAGDTEVLIALHQSWGSPPHWENWLSREPIGEWQGVSVGFDGRVAGLDLGWWSGDPSDRVELPMELGNLSSLRVLTASSRSIAGELPAELGNLTNLQRLTIDFSHLEGTLPAELGNLPKLRDIVVVTEHEAGFALGGCSSDVNRYAGTIMERACEASPPEGGWKFASVSSAVANEHNCGVKTDGAIECWGASEFLKADPPDGQFRSVSVGMWHACGVKTDGAIECWGYGQVTPPQGEFASVSAGREHTCGVMTNSAVVCWGNNESGQATPPDGQFASVNAGWTATCGVRTDGAVECWGAGAKEKTPFEGQFTSVGGYGAYGEFPCGLRTDSAIECWWDSFSQIWPPEGEFASLSVGPVHLCAVRTDGTVECSGKRAVHERTVNETEIWPPQGERFASVSVGSGRTCGVRADGTVQCYGWGTDGGHNTPPDGRFRSVEAGAGYICAVRNTDEVRKCLGEPPAP